MSHFGRLGPPDIKDTFSLLVINISFRTTADDLYALFEKYGKVVDVHIPRDRRTGESRGFAFVRYAYADEAQKAVDRIDGRNVDGRSIKVQFAKYGPNAEPIRKGRIAEAVSKSRSRSPRPRSRDDHHSGRDYRRRSRSRSRSREMHGRGRHYERERDRDRHRRSRSRSLSPDYNKRRGRRYDDVRSRSRSIDSFSPVKRSRDSRRSVSPHDKGVARLRSRLSPASRSLSPHGRRSISHSSDEG